MLTPEDIASLQPLSAEEQAAITPRMGGWERFGKGVGNIGSDVINDTMGLLYNVGLGLPGTKVQVPETFDVPAPVDNQERLIDLAANVTQQIPVFMTGASIGSAVGRAAKLGKIGTGFAKAIGEWGLPGLLESPEHAAAGAGLGAATEAASFLPARVRLPLAATVAAVSASGEYMRSGDPVATAAAGALGVPFLFGRGRVKVPPVEDLSTTLPASPEIPLLGYTPHANPVDPFGGMRDMTRQRLGETPPIDAEPIIPPPPSTPPLDNLLRAPRGVDFETQGQPFPTRTPRLNQPEAIINPIEFSNAREFTLTPDSNGVLHVHQPYRSALDDMLPEAPANHLRLNDRSLGTRIEGPALIDAEGNVLAKGKIGDSHQSLMNENLDKENADAILDSFMDDANHVFITDTGAKLDRKAGARFAIESGQAEAGIENLHSQHLTSHAEAKAKAELATLQSTPDAVPPVKPAEPIAPRSPRPPTSPRAPTAPRPPEPPKPEDVVAPVEPSLKGEEEGIVEPANAQPPKVEATPTVEEPKPKKAKIATLQKTPPSKLKASVGAANEAGKVPVTIGDKEYGLVKMGGKWHDANTFDPKQPTLSELGATKQEAVKALKRNHEASPPPLERGEVTQEGFKSGDWAMADTGGGMERVKVISSQDGMVTFKTGDGYEFEQFERQLKPHNTKAATNTPPTQTEEGIGGLRDLDALHEQNRAKRRGMKLKNDTSISGAIPADLALDLGRYVAAPLVGAAVGAAMSDSDHRVYGAAMGALSVGAMVTLGPKAFRMLADASPNGNVAKGLKQAMGAATASPKMAGKAAIHPAAATGFERIARWMEQALTIDLTTVRIHDKAKGEIDDMAKLFHSTLRSLALDPMARTAGVQDAMKKYFYGIIDTPTLYRSLGATSKPLGDLIVAAKQSANALEQVVADGLHDSGLRKKILKNKDKYLTTAYRIFFDDKYLPTDVQIAKAAMDLDKKYGSLDNRVQIIRQYLAEIKANRRLFRAGGNGEALTSVLAKETKLSDSFKDMLGIYDDPVQMMTATASKLINGARTANFFDEISKGIRPDGLKMIYSATERDATMSLLHRQQTLAISAGDAAKVATLQKQIDQLGEYVWNAENPIHGKLSGTFVHRRVRDSLATFDSLQTTFHSNTARTIAQVSNSIRYGKIVLSPLQLMRQVVGIPLLGLMARTGPIAWGEAFSALRDPATRTRLNRLGVAGGDQIQGMLRGDIEAMMNGNLDHLINQRLAKGLHKWEEAFRTPDLIIRVSSFMKKEKELLDGGMAPLDAENAAIDHMNRYTMNYGAVPKGIKLGRQVPFVNQYLTFAYEAARIAKNIGEDAIVKKDPAAMATLVAMATYPLLLQKGFEAQLSDSDLKEWKQLQSLQPSYMRGNFNLVMGKDKNGNFKWANLTPLIIHDWLMKSGKDIMNGDVKALMADNPLFGWDNTPLLSLAASQAMGRDLHTSQPLNSIQKRFDSARRELAPPLIGSDLDRFNDALTPNAEGGLGIADTRTGRGVSLDSLLLSYLTSIRGYTQNLEASKRMAMSQAKAEIVDLHNEARRVMNSNARQSYKDEFVKRVQLHQKQILMELGKTIGSSDLPQE